jgi:uncharacterized protein YecT (DUF1311 family)
MANVVHAGGGLSVAHRVFAEQTAITHISLAYPATGLAGIDNDIRSIVVDKAKEFRSLAQGDYLKGEGVYTDDAHYEIARNDSEAFAVVWNEEADFHGAHPSHEIFTAEYLLPDGWRIYLPEIVDGERGLKLVSALAMADLDRQLLGPDGLSDKDWIARGTAPTAPNFENFILQRDRLRIEFPPYQVAAYAAGPQSVEIPLAKLRPAIRPNWRAPQASFDCSHARAEIEKMICSDARLARLDRQVAETYFEHLGWIKDGSVGTSADALRGEQRAWLAKRATACNGKTGSALLACLSTFYGTRLDALVSVTQ